MYFSRIFICIILGNAVAGFSVPKKISRGVNRLFARLYTHAPRIYHEDTSDYGGVIFSPYDIFMILSKWLYGAEDETKCAISSSLRFAKSSHDLVKNGFRTAVDEVNRFDNDTLIMANMIFHHPTIVPRPAFTKMMRQLFDEEPRSLSFGNEVKARETLNQWAKKRTNNHITNVIPKNEQLFNDHTDCLAVSVAYFKGIWSKRFFVADGSFSSNHSAPYLFRTSFMRRTDEFNHGYLENVNSSFVEIPCKSNNSSGNISMFIILPKDFNGITALERNISFVTMNQLLNGTTSKIHVQFPTVNLKVKVEYSEALKKMGLARMFSWRADFSKISKNRVLRANKIIQTVHLIINETQPETSAVAEMQLDTTQFIANHGFMIIIATTDENPTILFTARYDTPDKILYNYEIN